MINEEAQRIIDGYIVGANYTDEDYVDCVNVEALRVASVALEKQVPQKPKSYRLPPGIKKATCPRCLMVEDESANYCRSCGQALEWG